MKRVKIAMSVCLVCVFVVGGALIAAEHSRTSPLILREANVGDETNGEQAPMGENFRGFRFGAQLAEFTNIFRVRPNSVLIQNDERTSDEDDGNL